MWLLLAPRAAKGLMVMRASGWSRLLLASAPRNSAVRGSQPETTARKSGRRLTRRCPVALQQVVQPGQTVLTVARPDIREAMIDLPENIGRGLRPGARLAVALQIDPSVHATGSVREIAP